MAAATVTSHQEVFMSQERLQSTFRTLCTITALCMVVYHFWYIVALPYENTVNAIIHLGFAFTILFLNYLSKKVSGLHLLLLLVGIGVTVYFFTDYEAILEDPSYPPVSAMIAGILATLVAFYLTYKAFGLVFPIVAVIGIVYMYVGSSLPGGLRAPTIDLERMITLLASDVTSPWGTYGSMLILSANYLFLFIIFGSILEAFGGLRFVMTVGQWVSGYLRSGAASLSIISSALLGSVTGSTVANITITGTFTIPLMKRSGYTAEQAAAIETAASNGGQILPPVMGSTVFIMSGFTGIPYLAIVKACTFSALIYFGLLLIYAELNARKRNIQLLESDPVDMRMLLFSAPVFIGPLMMLLYLLSLGISLMKTVYYCILFAIALGLICNFFQRQRLTWAEICKNTVSGVVSGSQIAVVLSVIGVAVACVEVTGLGMRLSDFLVGLSQNSLIFLLLLTAVTAIILGMGLPSPAVYIICATILSPALVKMGVPLLQAHLFPLYYALFSHLTPPVGIGLMVACKMADADYLKSALEAMKAAFPSFVMPFLFVYSPGVLLLEAPLENFLQLSATVFMFVALSMLFNWYFAIKLTMANAVVTMIAFLLLMGYLCAQQMVLLLVAGVAVLALAIVMNIMNSKKMPSIAQKETV